MTTQISISSSQGSYDVVLERGSLIHSDLYIAPVTNARRALIVADEAVTSTHAAATTALSTRHIAKRALRINDRM